MPIVSHNNKILKFNTKVLNYAFIDIDALAFITAAGIIDPTQITSINYLVVNLKGIGIWTKIFALYPFVGGTATTHKYNLKNPLDTDAAMRLTFVGGVTHDANGITPNGLTGYANTHAIPTARYAANSECMFLYSRTSVASPSTAEIDMGCAVSTGIRDAMAIRNSSDSFVANINSTTLGSGSVATTNTDGRGFFLGSRVASNDLRIFKNGIQVGTTATGGNGTRAGIKIYIGCRNVANAPNGLLSRNYAMAGMSSGLSVSEVSQMYTIVQTYQTLLGRQV